MSKQQTSTRTLTYTDRLLDDQDAKAFYQQESKLKKYIQKLPLRERKAAEAHLQMMQREAFFVDLMQVFEANPEFVSLRFSQYGENVDSDDPADNFIFVEASTDPDEEPEQHGNDAIVQLEQQLNDIGRREHWDFITTLMEAGVVPTSHLPKLADDCLGADWNALRLQQRLDLGVPEALARSAQAPRL